ncbi:MAG: (deoxy)nucleoside triphosphate pyrophosphohydrolase [Eubacteriales bacterium]
MGNHMIQVTAAIIERDDQILICQRSGGGSCAFHWEFPGGKLEPDETREECLVRECKEELGVDIGIVEIYKETIYRYPDNEISFTFFKAAIISGDICMNIHKDIRWVERSQMKDFVFCPADVPIAEQLCKDIIENSLQHN